MFLLGFDVKKGVAAFFTIVKCLGTDKGGSVICFFFAVRSID